MLVLPQETLDKLKCVFCDCYLSCSPVYVRKDGQNVCGRCPVPAAEGIRNIPYEELANFVAFPCIYEEHGCTMKIAFKSLSQHEEGCLYRPLICPLVPSGECEWVGRRETLLEHCRAKHPLQELQNPVTFNHDIRKNTTNSFLMYVYQFLFLVQTKVCVATSKIFHSVRLIGDPERASEFSVELEVVNNGGQLKTQRSVAPQGCLAIQEDSSLVTDINALLTSLGTFNDTTFILSLNKALQRCFKCKKDFALTNRDIKGESLCDVCISTKEICKYYSQGCKFQDAIDKKMLKHFWYYCEYIKECWICKDKILWGSLQKHRNKKHSDIINTVGETWNAKYKDSLQWHIVNSDSGSLLCGYYLTAKGNLSFAVHSPLPSDQLADYECVLSLSHPQTERNIQRHLTVVYNDEWDWFLEMPILEIESVMGPPPQGSCNVRLIFVKCRRIDDNPVVPIPKVLSSPKRLSKCKSKSFRLK